MLYLLLFFHLLIFCLIPLILFENSLYFLMYVINLNPLFYIYQILLLLTNILVQIIPIFLLSYVLTLLIHLTSYSNNTRFFV